MGECIFCKIVNGEIPAAKVYEDELVAAFLDIGPINFGHVLVIPKCHIASMDEVNETNSGVVAKIFEKIPEIAKMAGVKNGYRLISNCGPDAGQSVQHLHFHILGGKALALEMA